jgi:SAM-dependent methyltransferase
MSIGQTDTTRTADAKQEYSWELFAKHDALWSVCTSGKLHVNWQLEDFLATGEDEVSWAFKQAREANTLPSKIHLALDFGCGPGRLSGALARRADEVLGIDTSPTMLKMARQTHKSKNMHFQNSFKDIGDSSVDLIYSTFVFQHLNESQRQRYFNDISRVLKPGGLFIFQYPIAPRFTPGGLMWRILPIGLISFAQRKIMRLPAAMPMSWAKPEKVERILLASQLNVLMNKEGLRYTPNWRDTWYFVTK